VIGAEADNAGSPHHRWLAGDLLYRPKDLRVLPLLYRQQAARYDGQE
jgi:hypothetical protein